ncbi:MAG: PAS domain S-box protein, partial [Bacteroidales bacterium]|nr:PAS domain S-box protein [Bacteroidales bacterium]
GYIHDVQFKIQHKDGYFLDISFEGSVAYTLEGEFKQTYCTFKDITKQKEIENALKESEERNRNLLETAPVGIAVHQDGFAVYINRKGCEIIKADSPDQIIGKPINQFIPDSVFEKVKLNVREILKGKKHIIPVEEQLICLDGTHVDVDISAMPIKYNNKLAVQIIVSDITERKKTEKEILEKTSQFKILTEAAGDALFVSDFETEDIVFVNKRACKTLGYTEDEILKLKISDLDPVFINENYREKIWKTMSAGEHKTIEAVHKRKDGSTFPVEIRTGLIEFNGRKSVLGFARDITERKKTEKELKKYHKHLEELVKIRTEELEEKAKKIQESQKALSFLMEDVNKSRKELSESNLKLSESNRDLESFAYSVSHDLKTPLRAIRGYSKVLLEDFSEQFGDELKGYLHSIIKNSNNMNALIDDLLRFARIGRNELDQSEFNLSVLVQDCFNEIKSLVPDKKPVITIQKNVFINADIGLMKQVMTNLLTNAVKYCKTDENPKIEFGIKKVKKQDYYFLKDNGIGFDMKYHDTVFKVFKRLHNAESYEGTGIGLSLVKRIINKHGGNVFAESEPEKGSTFYFKVS